MIEQQDVLAPEDYERVRTQRILALSRHKARRRIDLGRYLCLLFESRETVLGQIQEIVRIEGRTSPAQIQREIDEYACLLPSANLLTSTLTIHAGPAEIGAVLANELASGEGPITLELGDRRFPCVSLRPLDLLPTAVHYIGFPVDEGLLQALRSSMPAWLRLRSSVEHHDLALPERLRDALAETLAASVTPRWSSVRANLHEACV